MNPDIKRILDHIGNVSGMFHSGLLTGAEYARQFSRATTEVQEIMMSARISDDMKRATLLRLSVAYREAADEFEKIANGPDLRLVK